MLSLAAAFLATALLYASVGFGGGSTYTALLALAGTDYRILPLVSLLCNVIVVTGGTIRYVQAGLIPWRRVLPLVTLSAPLALLGGLTPIKQPAFMALLGVSLLVAGVLLLFQGEKDVDVHRAVQGRIVNPLLGGAVGYLSGIVGIGGGIFLAPVLHLIRWGQARQISATASFFILINSLAGLAGQGIKLAHSGLITVLPAYWPLGLAVLIGGQIGSYAGMHLISQTFVRRGTAVLILYVAVQLLVKSLRG